MPTAHYLLPTAHHLLPTTHYLLLTARCLLPTTQDAAAHLRVLSDPSKEYVLHGAA